MDRKYTGINKILWDQGSKFSSLLGSGIKNLRKNTGSATKKYTSLRPCYVLFSLAVCDFMTGIINIPLFIIESLTPVIKSFEVRYYMAILVSVLNNLTAISSCYHILIATTEKYLSIIWPVTHRLMTKKISLQSAQSSLGVVYHCGL